MWASSQLEGNTYSRLDTVALIEQGRAARGKAAIEAQMILNHKTAIADPLPAIAQAMGPVPQVDRAEVQALVVQELRRLHEGLLARYGLRPSELAAWKAAQQSL